MLSESLKIEREKRNLSKAAMARLLNIPYTTYNGYESGYREPKIEQIQKIATVLNIPFTKLLDEEYQGFIMDNSYFATRFPILSLLFQESNHNVSIQELFNTETKERDYLYEISLGGNTFIMTTSDMETLQQEIVSYLKFKISEISANKNQYQP